MIFTRQLDGRLTSLVKEVDKFVKSRQPGEVQAFVTFLTDDASSLQPKLEEVAKKEGLRIPLTIAADGSNGPAAYKLDPATKITVIFYNHKTVQENLSLDSPSDADIQTVLKTAGKMLSAAAP